MRLKVSVNLSAGAGALVLAVALSGSAHAVNRGQPTLIFFAQPEELGGGPASVPAEKVNYDEVGYASWYGDEMAGRSTASGEPFNPDAISAAHPTLPLASFVEVTNLDSGRTILVRINDRGPSRKGRIIDISMGAARQLGVESQGQFPVRVRRVNPPAFERRQLLNGGQATERLPTPPALLAALRRNLKPGASAPSVASKPMLTKPTTNKPKIQPHTSPPSAAAAAGAQFDPPDAPSVTAAAPPIRASRGNASAAVPASPASGFYVQIGAFSNEARANALAERAGASVVSAGPLWRVRMGPYADEATARAALGALAVKGYTDARVTR